MFSIQGCAFVHPFFLGNRLKHFREYLTYCFYNHRKHAKSRFCNSLSITASQFTSFHQAVYPSINCIVSNGFVYKLLNHTVGDFASKKRTQIIESSPHSSEKRFEDTDTGSHFKISSVITGSIVINTISALPTRFRPPTCQTFKMVPILAVIALLPNSIAISLYDIYKPGES